MSAGAHSINLRAKSFFLQHHAGEFDMTLLIHWEYVYEPFLLVNCLFPIHSPTYETRVWADAARIASRRGVVMDGHSAIRSLLTRGRPYFSFSHLHEDGQGRCSVRSAGPRTTI